MRSTLLESIRAYELRQKQIRSKARRKAWKRKYDPKYILWIKYHGKKHTSDNKRK